MSRPRVSSALVAVAAALTVAAAANLVLLALAGPALRIPGEMSAAHVAGSTLAAIPLGAGALWAWPRRFATVAMAAAVLTIPFALLEFGGAAGAWLAAMHLVAGISAALLAPRVTARLAARAPHEPAPAA
jgi:hypothetical protein